MGSEWAESTLEELSSSVSYGYTESASSENIGPHFLRITDIQNGVVDWDSVPYCPITEKDHLKYKLNEGDIVVARTGNSTGENFIFEGDHDAVFASYLIRFAIDENLAHPKFVWYSMRSPSWWAFVNGSKTGSAQAGANAKVLGRFPVDLPPLPEQKAIAHILGTLDDKIELNRRMNATLEGMAQALFKSWFVDFDPVIDNALAAGNPIPDELAPRAELRKKALANGTSQQGSLDHPTLSNSKSLFPAAFQFTEELGWIPEGWDISSFGDVSNCFDRKRIPLSKKQREEKKPGAIPYYGATSIMDFIDEWIFDDTYLLVGEDGSVMKDDGSPFIQYIWGKTWVNNHAHVLQGDDGVSTEHLILFMQAQDITPYVTGAVQLKINQKNMNSIPFLNAGSDLNRCFSECITPFYERIRKLTEENETLTKLRDTLLPKLISGELCIPNSPQLASEALR